MAIAAVILVFLETNSHGKCACFVLSKEGQRRLAFLSRVQEKDMHYIILYDIILYDTILYYIIIHTS